jgi:hypothetical protein
MELTPQRLKLQRTLRKTTNGALPSKRTFKITLICQSPQPLTFLRGERKKTTRVVSGTLRLFSLHTLPDCEVLPVTLTEVEEVNQSQK